MPESFEISLEEIEGFHNAIKQGKDNKLSIITEFVEQHGEVAADITVEISENDGNVNVTTSNGLELNDLLPDNYRFIRGSGKYFWANGVRKTIEVPSDFQSTEIAKQQLSHELGHVLDPGFEELSQEITAHWNMVTDSSDSSLDNAAAAVNKNLELEIQAHNYGKIVSQALGVDQVRYEDRITNQLQEYLLDGLEKLATVIDWDSEDVKDKKILILDPISQNKVDISLGEVESMLIKKYEE